MLKFCTKFERNRAIRGGYIAISVFDLMTLNICYMLHSPLEKLSPSLTFDNLFVPEVITN